MGNNDTNILVRNIFNGRNVSKFHLLQESGGGSFIASYPMFFIVFGF